MGHEKSELNELAHVDAHSAGIISLEVVTTESVGLQFINDVASKYCLISCSKNTEIRGWTINKDGTIYLMAHFTGSGDLLSVKTVLFRSLTLPDGSVISGKDDAVAATHTHPLQEPGTTSTPCLAR